MIVIPNIEALHSTILVLRSVWDIGTCWGEFEDQVRARHSEQGAATSSRHKLKGFGFIRGCT